jgi:hypothetical protein
MLALVGEAGPEFVVPEGKLAAVISSAVRNTLGANGGGNRANVYNLTVNLPPGGNPAEAGRQIVEQIRAYERTSGAKLMAA